MAAPAWSDGVMMDGVSPRSLSRGGTDIGFADNGGIIYDDPAAMVNINGQQMLDIGVNMLIVSNQFTNVTNPGGADSTTFTPAPEIGIIRKSDDGVWAYGLGVFTPAGFSERYNMQGPPQLPGEHEYESFAALEKILPSLACRVTDRLSIGGTLGVGYNYAELQGPYILQDPALAGTPTLLHTHGSGADLVWSLGMQYQWTDCTTVGVTYQSPAPFKLRGDTSVTIPGLGSSTYDSNLRVEWPESVGIGIRQQLSSYQVFAVDVIWNDWEHSFDQFTLNLNNPNNPTFRAIAPNITEQFPLDWHDSVSLRLGYEQQLDNGMTLRLGYVFHPNPIPDNTLTPFIQATLEHAVSIGLGWKWNCWDVDLGYIHEFSPQLHEGSSAFVGGDFDNSTHDAQVNAIVLDFIRNY
jgi:long-chain fatty acid transport protein